MGLGLAISGALAGPGASGQSIIYMAANGDDGNSGLSKAQAVATWARVEELVGIYGYSTINLLPGTYTGTADPLINPTIEGLIIVGSGAIIDGETARVPITIEANNVTLQDIVVTQSSGTGITVQNATGVNLKNCISHTNTVMGIYAAAGSHDCLIADCETYNNTSRGFYARAALRVIFRNCYAHDNSSYGYEAEASADDALYEDCWANANGSYGFIGKTSLRVIMRRCVAFGDHSMAGYYFKGAENGSILNCDGYGNTRGAYIQDNLGDDGSINCTIKNCVFSNNSRGIDIDAASQSGFTSDYNCIVDGVVGYWGADAQDPLSEWQTTTSQDANSNEVDPNYATAVYGGFVPQAAAVLTGADDGGPQGHTG